MVCLAMKIRKHTTFTFNKPAWFVEGVSVRYSTRYVIMYGGFFLLFVSTG
jgi:hypothetical protein